MNPVFRCKDDAESRNDLPFIGTRLPQSLQVTAPVSDTPSKIRLLLVDDQIILRQALVIALSEEHNLHVVGQANHGGEAIELATKLQPDVILMDICMPVCNGIVATHEIHRSYPWIKILVITSFYDEQYIRQAMQAGALNYLLKNKSSYREIATAARAAYYSCLLPRF